MPRGYSQSLPAILFLIMAVLVVGLTLWADQQASLHLQEVQALRQRIQDTEAQRDVNRQQHIHWLAAIAQQANQEQRYSDALAVGLQAFAHQDLHNNAQLLEAALFTAVMHGREYWRWSDHASAVLDVHFSQDGQWLLSHDAQQAVLRRISDGQRVQTFKTTQRLQSALLSADQQAVLLLDTHHGLTLWDSVTAEKHWQTALEQPVNQLSFSADGQLIAAACGDATVRLWERRNGQPQAVFHGHKAAVQQVSFSSDGRWLATGSDDHTARIWSLQDNKLRALLKFHKTAVNHVAFSRDSKYLLSSDWDGLVRVWNHAGRPQSLLQGRGGVLSAHFSQDGKQLVSSSTDGTVRLWQSRDGQLLREFRQVGVALRQARLSPDGKWLLSIGEDHAIYLWRVADATLVAVLKGHQARLTQARFSPDSAWIVSSSTDASVRLWQTSSQSQQVVDLSYKPSPHTPAQPLNANAAAWSPDGSLVASGDAQGHIYLHTAQGELQHLLRSSEGAINALSFSHAGHYLVTAHQSHAAQLWDVRRAESLQVLSGHNAALTHVAFSPDDRQLLTVALDQTVGLWALYEKTVPQVLSGHDGDITHAAFSPNGQRLVTSSEDHTARLWNTAQATPLLSLTAHQDSVLHAAFSPDNQYLVTSSADRHAHLWAVDSGALLHSFAHPSAVLKAHFSPDSRLLLTATLDGVAWLWQVDTQEALYRFSASQAWLEHIAFSPDGKRLLTAAYSGEMALRSVTTGRKLATWQGNPNLQQAAFAAHGRQVLSLDHLGQVRLWTVFAHPQALLQTAQARQARLR